MTRHEAKNWAEKALIIWVEGNAPSVIRQSESQGDHMDAEQQLVALAPQLVERAISQTSAPAHVRACLRKYVASRKGKAFFWEYTYRDHTGPHQGASQLLIFQCRYVLSKLVLIVMEDDEVNRLVPLFWEKVNEQRKSGKRSIGGILVA